MSDENRERGGPPAGEQPGQPEEPEQPEPEQAAEPEQPEQPGPGGADEPKPLDSAVEQLGGAPPGGNDPPPSPASTPAGTETYNLRLDATRRQIAFFLLWIMAGVIAAPVFATIVFSGWCWWNGGDTCTNAGTAIDLLAKSMSQFVTAMVGLVGSVVGFYFGSKQN